MSYTIAIENGIATFTIDRPEMRNAINYTVMDGLEQFLNRIENNEDVAYAVITGAGDRAFCSGGDLSEFHTLRTADEAYPMLSRMSGLLYRVATLPMPVIALVNGAAVGGGCEIATACDYRVMSSTAKAGFIQGTLAITTGWGGATLLFEKDGKHDRVLRLLSEAGVHTADQMLEAGWATEIYEGTAEKGLQRFLAKMSAYHPAVHFRIAIVLYARWTADFIRDRMIEESRQCSILWGSDAHHEEVAQFLSKK